MMPIGSLVFFLTQNQSLTALHFIFIIPYSRFIAQKQISFMEIIRNMAKNAVAL